ASERGHHAVTLDAVRVDVLHLLVGEKRREALERRHRRVPRLETVAFVPLQRGPEREGRIAALTRLAKDHLLGEVHGLHLRDRKRPWERARETPRGQPLELLDLLVERPERVGVPLGDLLDKPDRGDLYAVAEFERSAARD